MSTFTVLKNVHISKRNIKQFFPALEQYATERIYEKQIFLQDHRQNQRPKWNYSRVQNRVWKQICCWETNTNYLQSGNTINKGTWRTQRKKRIEWRKRQIETKLRTTRNANLLRTRRFERLLRTNNSNNSNWTSKFFSLQWEECIEIILEHSYMLPFFKW